jgi:hypothetical protein
VHGSLARVLIYTGSLALVVATFGNILARRACETV